MNLDALVMALVVEVVVEVVMVEGVAAMVAVATFEGT